MGKSRLGKCKSVLIVAILLAGSVASTRAAQAQMRASDSAVDMRAKNAQMLIQTLSEEKTEIANLAAQETRFRKMGGSQNLKIATMWRRWIAEHKAAGPMLMKLIKNNGGDPMRARILKSPALGSKAMMLMATHRDHEAAVATSKMRAHATNNGSVRNAMTKRVALASKHLREMAPYHSMKTMKAAAMCPHCNVSMKDGKCPMCGMSSMQTKSKMMCEHCNVAMKDGKCPMCGMTSMQMKGKTKGKM